MTCNFSQIMLSSGVLFGMNEICSEELLCMTDSWAHGSPVKFTKGKRKAQHLGCNKPCNRLTG